MNRHYYYIARLEFNLSDFPFQAGAFQDLFPLPQTKKGIVIPSDILIRGHLDILLAYTRISLKKEANSIFKIISEWEPSKGTTVAFLLQHTKDEGIYRLAKDIVFLLWKDSMTYFPLELSFMDSCKRYKFDESDYDDCVTDDLEHFTCGPS